MDFKLETTCEGRSDMTLYPDLIPESGDMALVIVTDPDKQETKLYVRRVSYDENSIILKGTHTKCFGTIKPDMIFAGDDQKNVMIVGRVEPSGHIVLTWPWLDKKSLKKSTQQKGSE